MCPSSESACPHCVSKGRAAVRTRAARTHCPRCLQLGATHEQTSPQTSSSTAPLLWLGDSRKLGLAPPAAPPKEVSCAYASCNHEEADVREWGAGRAVISGIVVALYEDDGGHCRQARERERESGRCASRWNALSDDGHTIRSPMVHDVDVVGGSIYFGEWTDRDVCASPEHLCNSVWGGFMQ